MQLCALEQSSHRGSQGVNVARRHNKAIQAFFYQILHAAGGLADDHGQCASHGFVDNQTPRVTVSRQNQCLCQTVEFRQILALCKAEELDLATSPFLGPRLKMSAVYAVPNKH